MGSNGACYAQIGNAVPPIMSFFIANEFRSIFGKEYITLSEKDWKLPYISTIIKTMDNSVTFNKISNKVKMKSIY